MGGPGRRAREEAPEREGDAEADRDLQEPEPCGAAVIEIDAQGLVDRHLQGGASAAERQHDGEAREAQEEHEARDAGELRPQHRPVEMPRDGERAEAEGLREAPVLRRNGAERVEHHPGDERRVEEHVREQDAGPAEDPRRPCGPRGRRSHPPRPNTSTVAKTTTIAGITAAAPRPARYEAPARETPAGERHRERGAERRREGRRQRRLGEREGDHPGEIGPDRHDRRGPSGGREERREAGRDRAADRQDDDRPGGGQPSHGPGVIARWRSAIRPRRRGGCAAPPRA